MYYILSTLDNYLRTKIKYAPDNQVQIITDTYQDVRNHLVELINETSIDI